MTDLTKTNVPENDAINVLTKLENTIHIEVEREFLTMNLTTINPIVREQEAIRNDIHRLSDKLENEVERLNTKIDFVEAKMDTKFQFHDKLLWTLIGLLVALSGFTDTNSIFIHQKLK